MISNIEDIDLDRLESFGARSLREITLHNIGAKLISNTAYDFAVNKLKQIDDEIERRRFPPDYIPPEPTPDPVPEPAP